MTGATSSKIDICKLSVIELKELMQRMKESDNVDEIVFETEKEEDLMKRLCEVCPLILSYVQGVYLIREWIKKN